MDDRQLAIRSLLELTFVVGLSLMLEYIPLNKKLISASNKTLSCMQISFYFTPYFWNLKYHNQWKIMHKIKEKYNLKDNGMLLIAQFASEQKCFKKKKLCPSKCWGEGLNLLKYYSTWICNHFSTGTLPTGIFQIINQQ